MRVLLVTNDFPPIKGGISAVAVSLTRCLVSWGHEVVVVAPRQCGDNVRGAGARHSAYTGYAWLPTRWIGVCLSLLRELLRRKVDLVMALNVSYGGPVLGLLPRALAPRTLLAAFGLEFLKHPEQSLFQRTLRWVYGRADGIMTVSHAMSERLVAKGVDAAKVRKIHVAMHSGGPDVLNSSGPTTKGSADEAILLTVARLVPRKGVDLVLETLPRLLGKFHQVSYWIVGDGPQREALEARAAVLGIQKRVRFWGEIDDVAVAACYHAADVFVMTPRSREEAGDVEGLGLTYIEAGLAGIPCVGTRSGGVPEAIAEGRTGLLVDEEDSNALEGALLKLLRNAALRRAMGQAGKERALRLFSENQMREDLALLVGEGLDL